MNKTAVLLLYTLSNLSLHGCAMPDMEDRKFIEPIPANYRLLREPAEQFRPPKQTPSYSTPSSPPSIPPLQVPSL